MVRHAGAFVAVLASSLAAQPKPSPSVSADQVLSIRSAVGGEQPEWSPDGSTIMFQSSLGGGSGLWAVGAEGGFPTRLVPNLGTVPYQSNYMPQYSPTGEWIAYASGKSGATEIWIWSPKDGRDLQLTRLGQTRINSMSWAPDGRSIAFAGDRYGSYDIWSVAVPNGQVTRLTTDGRYEVFPSYSPDGRTILYVQLDDRWVDHDIMAIPATGGTGRLVTRDTDFFDYGAGRTFGYPMVSPDGRWVMFRSHRSGWINYWVAPIAGGSARPVAPESADQSSARWSPDGKSIAYLANRNGTQDLRTVAAAGGTPRVLVAPTGAGTVANPAWSPDGTRIAYTLGSPTEAADLYLVAASGGPPRRLTNSVPGGNIVRSIVAPEKISYQSGSFEINAYLYRPATIAPGERLPALLYIHGGPTAQFSDTYQAQVQFFVQQGYVVLLPNIRGSSGYGRAFEDANNKDWGHGDLDDVKAGAEYLKRLSYVNGERLGITGTSYGGCMTLSAIAFAPGYFQAAVAGAGYGDWLDFYTEQEYRHVKLLDYEFGPLSAATEAIYRRSSPYFSIGRVQTPVMLLHGTGRFPNSQASKKFADELERHYKVFRYQTYPNENYYVNSLPNQRQMFLDMLDFFDRYLKDQEPGRTGVATGSGR
ncbi:MAG: S9 family peptidase [Gemmatimonadetes bacterium]|nr:S9 family peptidase [Gemmatimonadota bacterium]